MRCTQQACLVHERLWCRPPLRLGPCIVLLLPQLVHVAQQRIAIVEEHRKCV